MIKLKRILSFIIIFVVVFTFGLNCERISDEIIEYINRKPELVIKPDTGHLKGFNFKYIRPSDDYVPYSKQDLLEIIYSILDNGWDEFTFYCPTEYTECLNDIGAISKDEILLSNLNSYVTSYNSYENMRTVFDTTGEIRVSVEYKYDKNEIDSLDKELDAIIASELNDSMSLEEKIKTLHDYIADRTRYDTQRADTDMSPYDSDRIHGVLYDGYAICSGYTDTMEIFLNKLEVPNFKVSSDNHVWNAVYIDGEWKHLDVTWGDPITNTGEDIIIYDYFLVDNESIVKDDDEIESEHSFDLSVFPEFNTN